MLFHLGSREWTCAHVHYVVLILNVVVYANLMSILVAYFDALALDLYIIKDRTKILTCLFQLILSKEEDIKL